ncbi:MAG TPA: asparaginase domain-containing protein [Burkholderiaceae bacterium]|nr:asparaginase domain-containing protein [Burkholderiaceae bacterium]
MTLRLIATGGTFDKVYDPLNGELRFTRSHVPDLLSRARLPADRFVVEELMLMDSLDMTDRHRQKVLAACRASPEHRIVVIHGTDTMADTAAVLAAASLPVTIVLTGAMVPYTIDRSDALFNLGHAIGCAQQLPPGVYIAMNGQAHHWDRVRKNRALGVFEPLEERPPARRRARART